MKVTLRRQMKNSIERFGYQPIEEWCLDYPQQVSISTLHLILTQEINDQLSGLTYEEEDKEMDNGFMDNKINIGQAPPEQTGNIKKKPSEITTQSKGDDQTQEKQSKNVSVHSEGGRNKQNPSQMENFKQKILRAKINREPQLEEDQEKKLFYDEAFGEETWQTIEHIYEEAETTYKKEEARLSMKNINARKASLKTKKPEYKELMLNVLQHYNKHSLFLRITFWINKLHKMLFKPKQESVQHENLNFDLQGISKLQIKSIILFLRYMQDMVQRLINLRVQSADDFEWQYKIKTNWNGNDEAELQCGGWKMQMGYEYLATKQRLLITPLTERYFVFIASSLREKNSIMFKCSSEQETASELVEELASFAAVPFKSIQCGNHMNVSAITQLLNGCALAQVWIFLEHTNMLPMVCLSILLKEIQLIHEQFAVSQFQRNLQTESNQQFSKLNGNFFGQNQRKNEKIIDFGVFGSISSTLAFRQNKIADSFTEHIRSSFRIMHVYKPDLDFALRGYLYVENFSDPLENSRMLDQFFKIFTKTKDEILYTNQEINQSEVVRESFGVENIRTSLKLASLLRNQEYEAFIKSQISLSIKEMKQNYEMDKFECKSKYSEFERRWLLRKKMKFDFDDQRQKNKVRRGFQLKEKNKIEFHSIQEGLRIVTKQKFQTEWLNARKRNPEWRKQNQDIIDMKLIEVEIDHAFEKAFLQVIEDSRNNVTGEQRVKTPVENQGEEKEDQDELSIKKIKKLTFRQEIRKSSLDDFKPVESYKAITQKIKKERIAPRHIRHSSTVNLKHQMDRSVIEDIITANFQQKVMQVADQLGVTLEDSQLYNCIGILQSVRRSRGIVIVGPVCSGKTQIFKIFSAALQLAFKINLKSQYISPTTFQEKELYGPKLAFEAESSEKNPHELQLSSVFQIILQNFEREKLDMDASEAKRTIQSFYIDQQIIAPELTDSLVKYLRETNLRERDYQKEMEFMLNLVKTKAKAQPDRVQRVAIRFPNGNMTMFPSDIFFVFETNSLENASPIFVSQVGIIHTQHFDVTKEHLIKRHIKITTVKQEKFLREKEINFNIIEQCCYDFVLPFINILDSNTTIKDKCFLWNVKNQINQLFILLNAQLYRLEENIETNKHNEDTEEYPFKETEKDCLWSIVLVSFVWSFGAVLNKECRKVFDELFSQFKAKFNINFNQPFKQRFSLFDFFFDIERLAWHIIAEKMEYRMKIHFDPNMQQIFIPTNEIAQAFFVFDNLVFSIDKDKELNKHIRLIGPSSSSKTVILHTFSQKVTTPVKTVWIPMSAYLTTTKLKKIIEQNYTAKRKNFLVPKDPKKRIVLVIDDVHMQKNLKIEVLEFLRSWSISNGYFDVPAGHFKSVKEFCTITAENSEFIPTTKKQERFMNMTFTLYCEEIVIDKYKNFIQTWLTSSLWPQSNLITKFYIIITNALLGLCEKMKRNDSFFNSSFSKLIKFQYIAKFCQNIIFNAKQTDHSDVFYEIETKIQNTRREEDAIADIFCYEAMRCFGDRIMRPSIRNEFMGKLSEICQKEFLCDKKYSPSYIESLTLGNYHMREPKAPLKLMNVTATHMRMVAINNILEKCKSLSGNQLLQSLLDSPNGLSDLYRISRILFKEKQNLTLVGLPGTSKHELIQLCTLLNECICLEIDVQSFGKPVQFADAFKKALLAGAKLKSVPIIILISDQQLRDPVYYDYIFNFMQHYAHFEEFVLFDSDFCDKLAQLEASLYSKLNIAKIPPHDILWRQAANKVRENMHIMLSFSDLMSYKEIFQLFPQFEYLTEVIFLDDLAPHGYTAMVDAFLARSKINTVQDFEEKDLSKSITEMRFKIKKQFLSSFYSQKMLKATISEPSINFAAAEYVFPEEHQVAGNIFTKQGGFTVMDKDLRLTLLNMPLEVTTLNKHRFGMFLELFRFLYDLIGMHLSIHKAYFETFITKKEQFINYFKSIGKSKLDLHEGSSEHSYREQQLRDKIDRIEKGISDKEKNIQVKEKENVELKEDLNSFLQQIDDVVVAKNQKLKKIIEELIGIPQQDFLTGFKDEKQPEEIVAICNIIAVLIKNQENAQMDRYEQIDWFLNRFDEMIDELNHKRQSHAEISEACFLKLREFIKQQNFTLYENNQVTSILYRYLIELYRKLNLKETMEQTYQKISDSKDKIDTNVFSISCQKQQIEQFKKDLIIEKETQEVLKNGRMKLSRKIEEAEISYMRTGAIYDLVMEYGQKINKKFDNVHQRTKTLLGDCLLLSASVTLLGCFSPEEKESTRSQLLDYFQKVKDIDCHASWSPPVQSRSSKPQKSIFMLVLKDLGLKEILKREDLPAVLTENDFAEALFSILFAPSCPVIGDPTGEMEKYIKEKFLNNLGVEKISGADIFGNEKLENCLLQNRAAIIKDVSMLRKINNGLSHDLPLFKRLSGTIYNGFDFHDVRTAQLKKINAITPFFSFYSGQNKRIQAFGSNLENISIYQAQIFQPVFDFLLNHDFTQNATFVCAAPSNIHNSKLEHNNAIVKVKEILLRNLLPSSDEFDDVRQKLRNLNSRLQTLSQNFENSFLIASGETLKSLVDYKQLQQAVENVIDTRRNQKLYQAKYDLILRRIELLNDFSNIILQIYIALKLTSKIMNEVTYSWQQYIKIVELILQKLILKMKMEEIKRQSQGSELDQIEMDQENHFPKQINVEIEIGKDFFRDKFLPIIHKTIMSNVKLQSINVFNLILSLRLSIMYETINMKEYQFLISQFVKLKEFWNWREDDHQFICFDEKIERTSLQELRSQLLQIYPDEGHKIFEFIEKRLGKEFTAQKASKVLQEEMQAKFNLKPLQMLTFGFICPDHEFKSKLTLFMYQQIESTFTFKEDVYGFKEIVKIAQWTDPIALFSHPNINVVNLVTSLAAKLGIQLKVMRTDPVSVAYNQKQQLEEESLNQIINDNLFDISNFKSDQTSLDYVECENLAHCLSLPKQSNQILQKQQWLCIKQRNADLDEGSVIHEINFDKAKREPVEIIAECAQKGVWVLICPIQFPQYTGQLLTKLEQMHENKEVHPDFKLIYDLQGLTQSEIPDSFLFEKSITFHLGLRNFDEMPTFNDIWAQILNPAVMEVLTSNARQSIRNVQMLNEYGEFESDNILSEFIKLTQDQAQLQTFKAFLKSQNQIYKEKLSKQQALTALVREHDRKIEQEKFKLEEERKQTEKKKIREQQKALAEERSHDEAAFKDYEKDPTV